jgi:hypothetical protein
MSAVRNALLPTEVTADLDDPLRTPFFALSPTSPTSDCHLSSAKKRLKSLYSPEAIREVSIPSSWFFLRREALFREGINVASCPTGAKRHSHKNRIEQDREVTFANLCRICGFEAVLNEPAICT